MKETNTIRAKYAIFLPVRNGADYVRQAIQSILAQTQTDWVLIVLENRSSDATLACIAEFRDPRIHVLPADTDLSIAENWARILAVLQSGQVVSEYATTIGHDDFYLPNFLELADELVARQPDASLYQTHFDLVDQSGSIIRSCKPIPGVETERDFFLARCWGLRDSFGTGYVFRSNDYVRVGGIPDLPSLIYSDDLLVLRLARLSFKACAPNVGFCYRLHRCSTSGAKTVNKVMAQLEAALRYFRALMQESKALLDSRYVQNAVSCLLLRDVLVFDSVLLRWMLPRESRPLFRELHALQCEMSPGPEARNYLGLNWVTRDFPLFAKRWNYFQLMLTSRNRG